MELRHLTYFRAVASELNFSRAAKKLNISQPPLSRQIKELEEELHVTLFNRGPRGLSITPAGRFLEQEVAKLLGRIEVIKERIGKAELWESRMVRIGFVPSAMYSFLPELIVVIKQTFPDLSFEFLELSSSEQHEALLSSRIDLGFVRAWIVKDGIKFIPLAEESMSLVYSSSMINLKKSEGINQFKELPFISFSKTSAPSISHYANMICANAGFNPRVVSTSGQLDSVLRLVSAGLGWSIVPTKSLSNFNMNINARELKELPEMIIVGIAIQEGNNDLLVLSLLDISVNFFSSTGASEKQR